MNSFELDIIDDKSRAGSAFMFRIAQELQRAFLAEKKARKITQQAIAEKLGTSRAVINRQLQGLENIGGRRIGELFWAMGWEPNFEAVKIPGGENQYPALRIDVPVVKVAPPSPTGGTTVVHPLKAA
jgi:HTH domain